ATPTHLLSGSFDCTELPAERPHTFGGIPFCADRPLSRTGGNFGSFGSAAPDHRRFSCEHDWPDAHFCRSVSSRDEQRATVSRGRGERTRACCGQWTQEPVFCQYEPRVAHSVERHTRLCRTAARWAVRRFAG